MTRALLALALGVLSVAVVGCGDDDDGGSDPPLVGEIAPAVEALEDELGRAPEYFEIRATPLLVTLWVSADQRRLAIPYVYADGELGEPDAAQRVEPGGFTFVSADALTFDADHIFDQVTTDLEGTTISEFFILGAANDTERLGATGESERGGRLDMVLAPDGEVLEVTSID